MVVQPQTSISYPMTLEAFDDFVYLPENSEKRFEYVAGEAVEVPSNAYVSKIAMLIGTLIGVYLMKHDIGHLTGEGGGYIVSGERYAPDVAFISYEHQPELGRKGYDPNPPELAVEVISDPDNRLEQNTLRLKLSSYLAAGTTVWIVDADSKTVEVHQSGKKPLTLDENDTLDGYDFLPVFALAVKDIFPKSKTSE